MDRYFVNCNFDNYRKTNLILIENHVDIIDMMDNLDGSSDFIIKCGENTAQQLRDLGVFLVRDQILRFNML